MELKINRSLTLYISLYVPLYIYLYNFFANIAIDIVKTYSMSSKFRPTLKPVYIYAITKQTNFYDHDDH